MSEPINFDPNMTLSGNRAKSTIRFVFGQWDYRCERTVEFKANWTGFSDAEYALGTLIEQLYDECNGLPALSMVNKSGDELICEDDEEFVILWRFDAIRGQEPEDDSDWPWHEVSDVKPA